jgi:large subunit ribosomal protein L13|tara:strand:- start:562 stop:996 length:435 start_codon:yes stop_codon:yes gene_type:complete
MKNTFVSSQDLNTSKWYKIDATDYVLGRLSTEISKLLVGKNTVNYTPFLASNNYVIIVNAEKIQVTGNKEKQKLYRRHSGYPGGMKIRTYREQKEKRPEVILEKAVKGMLPKGPLGRQMFSNLKVYTGPDHPHIAQEPELIEVS